MKKEESQELISEVTEEELLQPVDELTGNSRGIPYRMKPWIDICADYGHDDYFAKAKKYAEYNNKHFPGWDALR